ncbi:MAG: cytidylate kinase-like family protein [Salinivirgaceae bacterium]|nr:cytidylate kinase-like family protein [Salinivirgaceae bacterium]
MNQSKPFIITISRQIGSGGAYVGNLLAKKLNIYYADREILSKAAQELSVLETDIEHQEEKIQSFWESYFQIGMYGTDMYLNPTLIKPTTYELFITESKIIRHIASKQSAVIIGRCGFNILQKHSPRVSVFLHADVAFRSKRIQELHKVSEKEALAMIAKVDKERTQFIEEYWIIRSKPCHSFR